MKQLWMVSGGVESVPAIKMAKSMGLHVIVSDGNINAPGFEFADEHVVIDTYNCQKTLDAVLSYQQIKGNINGIICVAADVPKTVAFVANALGLPGISNRSAELVADKLLMKAQLQAKAIPIPWYSPIFSLNQLREIINKTGYPLVLKPVDSRGARGVLVLSQHTDLQWAYSHSLAFSPTSRVMVEEFLSGPQISTETILVDSVGYTLGFADRNYEYLTRFSPFVIENGGQQPSQLLAEQITAVTKVAESAAIALGITNGVAKGDMVLTEDGPKVIEIAGRLSGGWFCTDQIPLATGVNFVHACIKQALGETLHVSELIKKYHKGVAIRYFFPQPGKVTSIQGIEQFQDKSWIHKLKIYVKPGEEVEKVTDHTKRAGFVITTGCDRNEAVERAKLVVDTIKIDTH